MPVRLVVLAAPGEVVAGEPFDVVVEARDPFGDRLRSYRGVVEIEASDSQALIPASYSFDSSDAGRTRFEAFELRTAGEHVVAFHDPADPEYLNVSISITVVPAQVVTLSVNSLPAEAQVGEEIPVEVTAHDSFGNVAEYAGEIALQTDDATAVVPANTQALAGEAAFAEPLMFGTPGEYTVEVFDVAQPSLATQEPIVIVPGDAVALIVGGFPNPVIAGTQGSLTVRAVDAFGWTAVAYEGTVQVLSSDPQAVLPTAYSFTASDEGEVTFEQLELRTVGTHWLHVSDISAPSIEGEQTNIAVSHAPAASLDVFGVTSPIEQFATSNVTIIARDPYGNITRDYLGTIAFDSDDTSAQLPSPVTFQPSDFGELTLLG